MQTNLVSLSAAISDVAVWMTGPRDFEKLYYVSALIMSVCKEWKMCLNISFLTYLVCQCKITWSLLCKLHYNYVIILTLYRECKSK